MPRRSGPISLGILLALLALPAVPAAAAPTLGFIEKWSNTGDITSWGGGATNTNPGTNGKDGAGDGYLQVATQTVGRLGSVSFGTEYMGNWQAAGIAGIRVFLRDVGTDDPLEIRFGIGNRFNFWQYNPAFDPPAGSWAEFVVDLRSASNFTQIIGTGTFDAALQATDRVHLRHDLAPFAQEPDQIQGDFGIDDFELVDTAVVPVSATTWGRVKRLYR
jgi:hypothetical protein